MWSLIGWRAAMMLGQARLWHVTVLISMARASSAWCLHAAASSSHISHRTPDILIPGSHIRWMAAAQCLWWIFCGSEIPISHLILHKQINECWSSTFRGVTKWFQFRLVLLKPRLFKIKLSDSISKHWFKERPTNQIGDNMSFFQAKWPKIE